MVKARRRFGAKTENGEIGVEGCGALDSQAAHHSKTGAVEDRKILIAPGSAHLPRGLQICGSVLIWICRAYFVDWLGTPSYASIILSAGNKPEQFLSSQRDYPRFIGDHDSYICICNIRREEVCRIDCESIVQIEIVMLPFRDKKSGAKARSEITISRSSSCHYLANSYQYVNIEERNNT